MRPTTGEIARAVIPLQATIPFFPTKAEATVLITKLLEKIIQTKEQLEWLITTAATSISKWEGFPQLYGLYCSRYPPHPDFPEPVCTVPGFTQEDSETAYQRQIDADTERKLLKRKQERKQRLLAGEITPEELEPFAIPEPKRVPQVKMLLPDKTTQELEDELAQSKKRPPLSPEEIQRRADQLDRELKERHGAKRSD